MSHLKNFALALFALALPGAAAAEDALVAVAANFAEPMAALETAFETASGHTLTVTTGSTGKIYAQIANGAPFDVFLAADAERPLLLEEAGFAVAGSRFTYAIGRIVLWSPDPALIAGDGAQILRTGTFRHIAIASPDLAPYGAAAISVMEALGVIDTVRTRIVTGENIGQAFAMVASGAAELGFVAASQVDGPAGARAGSRWTPPESLYAPILQDAVLTARAQDNAAARAFLEYLKSKEARALIAAHGYGSGEP